jgi:hypothetical protein
MAGEGSEMIQIDKPLFRPAVLEVGSSKSTSQYPARQICKHPTGTDSVCPVPDATWRGVHNDLPVDKIALARRDRSGGGRRLTLAGRTTPVLLARRSRVDGC